ncbi:MAG: NAD-dependent succinate-semialdehyde dehydrogenase [Rhodobacteraceae bacterium]|nr:NAD-dependent succinate-semialdehyde dehydrogenase [Paracoccaceae bacterium]
MPQYEPLALLIDGEFRAGSEGVTEPVYNPATGEVLAQLPHASAADLDLALEVSQRAFDSWSRVSAFERQQILDASVALLYERIDEIAATLSLENGKPFPEARIELDFAFQTLKWYAEEARRAYGRIIPTRAPNLRPSVRKEPVGPAVAFVAWNFPANNVMRKVAGAVAAGCSLIIKPSEETPGTAIAIARAMQDAGLPGGVLQIVFGVPDTISRHLLASPIPRKLSVTGSTAVGKHLTKLAADTLKRTTMELGGHAPVIVTKEADIDAAIAAIVPVKTRNAGQVCTSPTRFLIAKEKYVDFVDGFSEAISKTRIGDPFADGTQMGALIAERRIDWMETLINDAVDKGASVATGGNRIGNVGNFFEPTVIKDATIEMRAMNEEPFGPFALMTPVDDLDSALAEANRVPVGLASYGFTRSQAEALRLQDELNAGLVGINQGVVSMPEAPFGGVDETGYGSEGGPEGLETFLRTKFVLEKVL